MDRQTLTQLPVSHRADIVVCGAGVAGAFAAIAAAREGMDVLLVEQFGMAGGSATAGLVTPVMHSGIEGDPACSYLSAELRDRLRAAGVNLKSLAIIESAEPGHIVFRDDD